MTSFGSVLFERSIRCDGVPSIIDTTTLTFGDNVSGSQRFRNCCLSSSSLKSKKNQLVPESG